MMGEVIDFNDARRQVHVNDCMDIVVGNLLKAGLKLPEEIVRKIAEDIIDNLLGL